MNQEEKKEEIKKIANSYSGACEFYKLLIDEWKKDKKINWNEEEAKKKNLLKDKNYNPYFLNRLVNLLFDYTKLCTEEGDVFYDFHKTCLATYQVVRPYFESSDNNDNEILKVCKTVYDKMNKLSENLSPKNSADAKKVHGQICLVAIDALEYLCWDEKLIQQAVALFQKQEV